MPTGITEKLHEEGEVSFNEFVWTCAKECGAFIHLREKNGPIDNLHVPSGDAAKRIEEHQQNINKIKQEIADLVLKSDDDLVKEYRSRLAGYIKDYEMRIAKVSPLFTKLNAMRAQVAKWNPPKEYDELKKFMLKMIDGDIEHDCTSVIKSAAKAIIDLKHSVQQNANQIRNEELEGHKRNMSFHSYQIEALGKEDANGRQKWVDGLHELVPNPWVKE